MMQPAGPPERQISHHTLLNISVTLKAVYWRTTLFVFPSSLPLLSAPLLFWETPEEIILKKDNKFNQDTKAVGSPQPETVLA